MDLDYAATTKRGQRHTHRNSVERRGVVVELRNKAEKLLVEVQNNAKSQRRLSG